MKEGSTKAVYAALIGNLAIAILKFVVALIGKSSAMLAESYHSLSDTGNQLLLLIGIKRSKRQPDKQHPFGYGKVQFFYAFIVAMLLFGVAGILSLREGLHKLSNPEPLQNVVYIFIVLGLSIFFEGYALRIAYRQLKEEMIEQKLDSIFRAIRDSKNPTILTVVFEDSLALFSIMIALISVALAYFLHAPLIDAIGSLIIGAMLIVFSIILAYEIKKLLIGESISEIKKQELIKAILRARSVNQIIDLRTMHLGPKEVIILAEVNLKDDLTTNEIEDVIDRIENNIKKIFPKVTCYIETGSQVNYKHAFGGIRRKQIKKKKTEQLP